MEALHLAADPGGGHDNDIRALGSLVPSYLGKAHLVADEQADAPEGGVDGLKELVAGLDLVGLLAAEGVIQVGLVVVSDDLALTVHHHTGVIVAVIVRIVHDFVHAEDHPCPVLLGQGAHLRDKGAVQALGGAVADLDRGAQGKLAHKQLREDHHIRLIFLCFCHRLSGLFQVVIGVSVGGHLS